MASFSFRMIVMGILAGYLLSFFSCGDDPPSVKKTEEVPKSALVLGNNISLRTSPLSTAAEIGSLRQGLRVKIKRRSKRRVRISGFNEYWYYVQLDDGLEGWVYGARLSVGEANAKSDEEDLIKGLKRSLIGKWWEIRPGGSTGYRKIYFWPDGKYKHGYSSGYMEEGKYEVLAHQKVILLHKGSSVGGRLRIHQVGRDLRLVAEYRGNTYTFRRGDKDPDSKEIGLERKK